MNNQGLAYAIIDLFSTEDKPRLYRRNTWFRDHGLNESVAILFLMFFTILAMAIISSWCISGVSL